MKRTSKIELTTAALIWFITFFILLTSCNKDWNFDGWVRYKIKAGQHVAKHVPKPRSTAGELETNFYFNETFYYDPNNLFTEDGDSCGNGYSKVIGITTFAGPN